jgi:hypothetical protein
VFTVLTLLAMHVEFIWLAGKLRKSVLSLTNMGFSLPTEELKNSFALKFLLLFSCLIESSLNKDLVNIFNDWLRLVLIDPFSLLFPSRVWLSIVVPFKLIVSFWYVLCIMSDCERRLVFLLLREVFNGGRL